AAVIRSRGGGTASTRRGLGRTEYEPISLERGLTMDVDFAAWAAAGQALDKGVPTTSLANLRSEILIELLNEAGQPVYRYVVHRCWVSEYQALADLDAGSNAIALEHVKLENEGWERDTSLAETKEL